MKTMVIGLSPEYNYPGKLKIWRGENTRYASNHGASLITRAICSEFGADYVDDFSDIPRLRQKYDCCVLALSTHIHPSRDVSEYAEVVEKLDMLTMAPSLGMSDYHPGPGGIDSLHPSVHRLLTAIGNRSTWLGVRGHYTASIVHRMGFRNAIPVGCPTVYRNGNPNYRVEKPTSFKDPVIVYHLELARKHPGLLKQATVLGQDYEDAPVFAGRLQDDTELLKVIDRKLNSIPKIENTKKYLREQGLWVDTTDEWIHRISQADFVIGPRIHGCIAAITQGVPAFLTPRDQRVEELAEMFRIPNRNLKDLGEMSVQDMFDEMDYSAFNENFKHRYNNYLWFLRENGVEHHLGIPDGGIPSDYVYSTYDVQTAKAVGFEELEALRVTLRSSEGTKTRRALRAIRNPKQALGWARKKILR